MNESTKAVFLSYAREDTDAARRIAEALRDFGVEVWFDQNELVGGDQWDQKIRRQIRECALFLPIISQNTQARGEGYFRLEWKLAAERTHQMADGVPFLAPVAIDKAHEVNALVPPEFIRVQWTRLAQGEPSPQFLAQIKHLVDVPRNTSAPASGEPIAILPTAASSTPVAADRRPKGLPLWVTAVAGVMLLATLTYFALRPATKEIAAPTAPAKPIAEVEPTVPAVSEKSVAVLAFADLSEAHNSEYFSDGISENLLDALAKVPGLRVAARTSAFFFKGKNLPMAEIAAKLNVAYVVEGSVQRAGDNVRITAQLIKAADGYHVWSDHFDRELKNIFAVQDEIAGLIAKQLSLKLGAGSSTSKAVKPEALELYLRARQSWNLRTLQGFAQANDALNRAIALEPNFAQAYALLAQTWIGRDTRGGLIGRFGQRASPNYARIQSQIDRAFSLEPNLADAHTVQGVLNWHHWKIDEAERELRLAIALNPNDATAHQALGRVLLTIGRIEEADAALQRATELDPLAYIILDNRAGPLRNAGRYAESLVFEERALAVQPDALQPNCLKAVDLSLLGRHDEAVALLRRLLLDDTQTAMSLGVFVKAGLRAEAEQRLARVPADNAYKFIGLAHLGRYEDALAALDPARIAVNVIGGVLFEPYLDPIRSDPRFVNFLATLGMTEAQARAQAWRAAHPLPPITSKQ